MIGTFIWEVKFSSIKDGHLTDRLSDRDIIASEWLPKFFQLILKKRTELVYIKHLKKHTRVQLGISKHILALHITKSVSLESGPSSRGKILRKQKLHILSNKSLLPSDVDV